MRARLHQAIRDRDETTLDGIACLMGTTQNSWSTGRAHRRRTANECEHWKEATRRALRRLFA